ncbi:MAG: sporulation protein [Myxococcota bacterium]|nr:sporulation protein [Myxococcota bacterium]
MAKCDLEIELNKRQFFPGETAEVTLWVNGNTSFSCKEITVDLIRRAHGKGNTSTKRVERISVYSGEIGEGEQLELHCGFVLPEAPLTYHGQYLNVDWIIKANVDVAWAFDPKCEIDFVLVSNPDAERPKPIEDVKVFDQKNTTSSIIGAIVLGFMMMIPLVIFVTSLISVINGQFSAIVALIFSSIFALVIGGIGFVVIRNRIALKAVGPVELRLDQEAYFPGQTLTGMISFTPQKKLQINSVNVTVICKEVVVRGSGTNKTTYTKNLVNQEVVVQSEMEAYPRDSVEIPFEFLLPERPMYSFSAPSNNLKWLVSNHIDIDRWPDFSHSWNFKVRG